MSKGPARQSRHESPPQCSLISPSQGVSGCAFTNLSSRKTFSLLRPLSRSRNLHRHRNTNKHPYIYTYHSHDDVRLQVTYPDGPAFSGFSSQKERRDMTREQRREKRREMTARFHRKRIEDSSCTMYHKIKHSSVKHTLRCLHIMHLMCCVGVPVCATCRGPRESA